MQNVAERCKLNLDGQTDRVGVHTLRHFVASKLLANGVEMMVVSRILGHESIKTTVDIYGHLHDNQRRRHLARLPREGVTMTAHHASTKLVEHYSRIAKGWIDEYQIASSPLSMEQLETMGSGEREMVWSAYPDWVGSQVEIDGENLYFRYGFPLVPGFEPGCDDYFIGTKVPAVSSSVVFLELRLPCQECGGDGDGDDGEDCTDCDGEGELVLDLDLETGRFG